MGLTFYLAKIIYQWHSTQLEKLTSYSSKQELIITFLPGMIILSGVISSLPWLFMICFISIKNLLGINALNYPMYYQPILEYQKSIFIELSEKNEKERSKVTFELLKDRLPPELIYRIVKEYKMEYHNTDCVNKELVFLDNEKTLKRMFPFLPPEYLIVVHKSDLWLIAFNIRLFALGMFYVGYLSVLKYIWCSV